MTETRTKRPSAPIAPESGRRHAWVTYLLFIGLVARYGFVRQQAGAARGTHALESAYVFYSEHPFVTLAPRFESWLGAARVAANRAEYASLREERGSPPPSRRFVERVEEGFVPLQEAALAELAVMPEYRYRVEGPQTPGANYVAHLFVEPNPIALVVSIVFLLLAGIALEGAWGSLFFAGLCGLATVGSAAVFAARYGASGAGWTGAGGLVAAILGAYLIRAFAGFRIPGWLLLPAWAGLEFFVLRGATWKTVGDEPWGVHAAAVGLGALAAAAIGLMGTEKAGRKKRTEEREVVSKNALDRAMTAREDGRPGDAFELLADEFEKSPRDFDVALALWDVAGELSQPQLGLAAILAVIRDAVRRGAQGEVARHWQDLAAQVRDFEAEPALFVHAAEALLEDGRPHEAVAAIVRSLELPGPLPGAMARRAALVTQALEPGLAARAAERALDDAQLPANQREALQALVSAARASGEPASAPGAGQTGASATAVGSAAVSGTAVTSSSSANPGPEAAGASPEATPSQPAPATASPAAPCDPMDVGSVSLDAVSADVADETGPGHVYDPESGGISLDALTEDSNAPAAPGGWTHDPEAEGLSLDAVAQDVTSPGGTVWDPRDGGIAVDALQAVEVGEGATADSETVACWNEPHLVEEASARSHEASARSQSGEPGSASRLEPDLDDAELEALAEGISDAELEEIADGVGDGDLEALASDELANLLETPVAPVQAPDAVPTEPILAAPAPTAVVPPDAPTAPAPADPPAAVAPAPVPAEQVATVVELAGARRIQGIAARPLELRADGFVFHVEGKGKSRVAYERIEGVAAGAFSVDSGKAVIVIDVLMNWKEVGDAPLRAIRLTSRGFDPRQLFPDAASPMEAMQRFIAGLLQRSGATPLPSQEGCQGRPFARFDSLAAYEREVLNAQSD